MDFRLEQDADLRFRLSGEVDMDTARQMIQQLEPAVQVGRDVWVDVSGLTFLDSAGVHALIDLGYLCGNGGRIIIEGPTGQVEKLFRLIGADTFPNLVIRWDRSPAER